jgi:hypothetical protein
MKFVRLSTSQKQSLLDQPESGMGYQWIEYQTPMMGNRRGLAINAELLIPEEGLILLSSQKLVLGAQMNSQDFTQKPDWKNLRVVDRYPHSAFAGEALSVKEEGHEQNGPAIKAEPEPCAAAERFVRFSAFANDHRITDDGRLRPGSYATTWIDAQQVKTGADAVRRYALPNEKPAVFWFDIQPMKPTQIQRGIVQPANKQPGGGVEVIFCLGTGPGTVNRPPKRIPDQ